MTARPQDYREIPENRHSVAAGSLLFPTGTKLTSDGHSSLDFVEQQGGDGTTFIFLFGVREARGPFGVSVEFIEGVFLSESGQGFRPTWGVEQLLTEIDHEGWKVVPTREVLERWTAQVEERMNKGSRE